jgi:xylose dehydrogenase (NAD/NADP)
MTAPVRYGILGAANIARSFCRGLAGSALATAEVVASRDGAKAAAFAAEMGVPRHLASYEALLADPGIEAIYIPLPNDMHCEWAIRCAEAGKHVLCEKPLAMGAEEAGRMYDAARRAGVHLVEAYPYMSQPQTLRVRALLREGAIGQVQLITTAFGFALVAPDGTPLRDPANIRLLPERGGGGLLDAGTYSMSMARIIAGERPARVFATGRNTASGVDQTVVAIVEFPSGAVAQVSSSMSTAMHRHAVAVGSAGVIETSYSNHAPADAKLTVRIKRGVPGTVAFETEEVDGGDGFRLEAESFARMVREGAQARDGCSEAESIDTALALAAIARSAREGGWVKV